MIPNVFVRGGSLSKILSFGKMTSVLVVQSNSKACKRKLASLMVVPTVHMVVPTVHMEAL